MKLSSTINETRTPAWWDYGAKPKFLSKKDSLLHFRRTNLCAAPCCCFLPEFRVVSVSGKVREHSYSTPLRIGTRCVTMSRETCLFLRLSVLLRTTAGTSSIFL